MNAAWNDLGGDRGTGHIGTAHDCAVDGRAVRCRPARARRALDAEPTETPPRVGAEAQGRRTVDDVAFELVVTGGGLADEAPCDGFYVTGPECLEAAHWVRVCAGCKRTIFSCEAHRRSWDAWLEKPPTGGRCTNCLTELGVPIEWLGI